MSSCVTSHHVEPCENVAVGRRVVVRGTDECGNCEEIEVGVIGAGIPMGCEQERFNDDYELRKLHYYKNQAAVASARALAQAQKLSEITARKAISNENDAKRYAAYSALALNSSRSICYPPVQNPAPAPAPAPIPIQIQVVPCPAPHPPKCDHHHHQKQRPKPCCQQYQIQRPGGC